MFYTWDAAFDHLASRLEALEEIPVLGYIKTHPQACLSKTHDSDSCYDVVAVNVFYNLDEGFVEYSTGLKFEIPKGYEIKAYARSSVSKKDLILANGVAVIDESYKGELILRFKELSIKDDARHYSIGDRVAQLQLVKKVQYALREVETLSDSSRGTGGFGSTGE